MNRAPYPSRNRNLFAAMKWVLVLAMCCIVVPINGQQASSHPGRNQKPANNTRVPEDQIDTLNVGTVNVNKLNIAEPAESTRKTDKDGQEPPSYLYRLVAPETLPNTILCIVGIAGVVAAFYTLKVLRRQAVSVRRQTTLLRRSILWASRSANAARESADAALLNAQAVINSERAWIMTEAVFSADLPGLASPTTLRIVEGMTDGTKTVSIDVCLICKNDGRTPAWIIEKQMHLRNLAVLPIEPDYVVDAMGDFRSRTLEPLNVGEESKTRWTLECEGPTEAPKTLVFYGYVKYRDAFGPERETRFAYTVKGILLRRFAGTEGYWEYNKYT